MNLNNNHNIDIDLHLNIVEFVVKFNKPIKQYMRLEILQV